MTTKSLPPEQSLVPETRSETPERRGRDDREIQPGPVQPNRWRTYVFAGGGYLLLSLFVWSNLWTHHPT